MKILAIDSRHDPITQAPYNYREKHVYPYLECRGFKVVRCQGKSARRIYVAKEASQDSVIYMTGAGHGTDTTYIGENCKPIFEIANYQPKEVEGKIVHFFACQTAIELGPDFVNHGCLAYFGYKGDFIVLMYISDAFFECDSEIDRAFADGMTAEEVYNRVIKHYNKKIDELTTGGHYNAAAALEHNRDLLCAPSVDTKWGNKEAKLK